MRTSGAGSRPRVRGLDGIRALAVMAVLASHTSGTGLPGGYLGVDAFFALSGFLITSLLLQEFTGTGGISLLGFWARRARRLLPALFLLLIAVGIGAALWPAVFSTPGLRADALATIFYFANWHLIAEQANYFVASGAQSPLQHTWSLAIEEQFYLVWPIVVLGVMKLGTRRVRGASEDDYQQARRRRLGILFALSVAGAVASAIWMALITTDPLNTARSYYGSDTRAQGLLLGASLAVGLALWGPIRSRGVRRVLHAAALAAIPGTACLWVFVSGTSIVAFRGCFFLAALATCAVIACVVSLPRSPLSLFLGLRPLQFLGGISYGMYLWYWPTVLAATPQRVHLNGYPLFAFRLVVISLIATASAYLVENRVRRGSIASWKLRLAAPAAAAVSVVSIFAATVTPSVALALPAGTLSAHTAAARTQPGGPLRILLVGDSMAGSLGVGMSEVAPKYGAVVANEGDPGCSLSMDKASLFLFFTTPPGPPCSPQNPQALFDAWRSWVQVWNPDVVLYFARGETLNQQIGNSTSWQWIGEPGFDLVLADRFSEALRVLGSRGAHVYLLGPPYFHSGIQGPGPSPWQEDNPARVSSDDSLMRAAVAGKSSASFIDVGAWLSPGGHYAPDVDGITARCGDGVHMTVAGGEWVAKRLLPMIIPEARSHHESSPDGSWPGQGPPPALPSWYPSLPCSSS